MEHIVLKDNHYLSKSVLFFFLFEDQHTELEEAVHSRLQKKGYTPLFFLLLRAIKREFVAVRTELRFSPAV